MDKYPDVQFMSEEQINEVDFSQPCWVLDPIDGTTNLIHDYHCSVISLALLENGEPTIGLIYNLIWVSCFMVLKDKVRI